MKSPFFYLAPLALCLSSFGAESIWMTDLEAAKKRAQEKSLPLFIEFTGSDWCGPCISVKEKVLNQAEFINYAKDQFILVEIDVPRQGMPEAQLAANKATMRELQVKRVPTFLLMTPQGQVVTGINGSGGHNFMASLKGIHNAYTTYQQAMASAALASTPEGAGPHLAAAYKSITPEFSEVYHRELREQIRSLDPQDTLGLQAEEEAAQREEAHYRSVMEKVRPLYGKAELILPAIEEELAQNPPQRLKYALLNLKGQSMIMAANSIEDIKAAKLVMEQWAALALPPASPEAMQKAVDEQFANPERLLDNVRLQRENNKPKP